MRVSWPGRLEQVGDHPAVLLDGGHNPAALRWLAQTIPELAAGRRLVVVFGMMAFRCWQAYRQLGMMQRHSQYLEND